MFVVGPDCLVGISSSPRSGRAGSLASIPGKGHKLSLFQSIHPGPGLTHYPVE
jgi:hypothetical protein